MIDLDFVFHVLSDPSRLRILEVLKKPGRSACAEIGRDEGGLCACDIQEKIGLSQASISHHMDLLRRAELISAEKRGRWMFYRRNEETIAKLAEKVARSV